MEVEEAEVEVEVEVEEVEVEVEAEAEEAGTHHNPNKSFPRVLGLVLFHSIYSPFITLFLHLR